MILLFLFVLMDRWRHIAAYACSDSERQLERVHTRRLPEYSRLVAVRADVRDFVHEFPLCCHCER